MQIPTLYSSVRIYVEHSAVSKMLLDIFYDEEWYICYLHVGKRSGREHVHVSIPYVKRDKSRYDKLSKRIKRNVGNGNNVFAFTHYENGVHEGIRYGSKDGIEPHTKGDVAEWIATAPEWNEDLAQAAGIFPTKKRKRNRTHEDSDGEWESGIRVNEYNIVDVAVRYYKRKQLKLDYRHAWRTTINEMVKSKKFNWLFKDKLPGFYEEAFLSQLDLKPSEDYVNMLLGFDFTGDE